MTRPNWILAALVACGGLVGSNPKAWRRLPNSPPRSASRSRIRPQGCPRRLPLAGRVAGRSAGGRGVSGRRMPAGQAVLPPGFQSWPRSSPRKGWRFLAIDSNRQDSLAEMEHFARTYKLTIPFLKDAGNVVADQFAAERTPEVFVLDRQRTVSLSRPHRRSIRFSGGRRLSASQGVKRDLAEAIDRCWPARGRPSP